MCVVCYCLQFLSICSYISVTLTENEANKNVASLFICWVSMEFENVDIYLATYLKFKQVMVPAVLSINQSLGYGLQDWVLVDTLG